MDRRTCQIKIESCIRGYHVYKDIWPHPLIDKELECTCKDSNPMDAYAVEVIRSGVTVGHIPRKISAACSLFLRNDEGNSLKCMVTGNRRHSDDLPQGAYATWIYCVLAYIYRKGIRYN